MTEQVLRPDSTDGELTSGSRSVAEPGYGPGSAAGPSPDAGPGSAPGPGPGSSPDAGTGSVAVSHLSRRFPGRAGGSPVLAFEDLSFEISPGEFLSVLGPSGCGKTTLLHVLAGLTAETAGTVSIDGAAVSAAERSRRFGYMFQKDLLMPWYRVIDNVALSQVVAGVNKREARKRAAEELDRYGLGKFAHMYPTELSGGMRQRAAVIRTLLVDRDILLLDEPFGALDALTRDRMQQWLLQIWAGSTMTVILVTHDVEEAVLMSDRVIVMSPHPGRIAADHVIDLPRPRDLEVQAGAAFASYKARLRAEIRSM